MNVSVELMDPLQYHPFLMVLLVLLSAWMIGILARDYLKKRQKKKAGRADRQKVIDACLASLNEAGKEPDCRVAHQKIAKALREAYGKLNGIEAGEMTLRELRHLDKRLYRAVALCYEPEFARFSNAATKDALQKAREACESWN